MVYSCDFKTRKTGSVCAGPAYVSYRYGPLGAPELEIDGNAADGRVHWGAADGQGEGPSATILRFTDGGRQYLVHATAPDSLAKASDRALSGVTVLRGDNPKAAVVLSLECPQKGERQERMTYFHGIPDFVPWEGDQP